MALPARVSVTEVGMRDGFQSETRTLATDAKAGIGVALIDAGIRRLEATSFVSPQAVPQLADAAELIARLRGHGAELQALVPNVNGAWRAAAAGVDRMIVCVSASETHNLKNAHRTIAAGLEALAPVGRIAADARVALTGAVLTAFGCPYEGEVGNDTVLRIVDGFVAMGASEVTLTDTSGLASPPLVAECLQRVRTRHPQLPLVLHFHNTRGLGLVNVMCALQLGVDRFEAAIGGLGTCPYSAGASDNVCTEDLAFMLEEMGIPTGIDLAKLVGVARQVEELFGRQLPGQLMKAGPRQRRPEANPWNR